MNSYGMVTMIQCVFPRFKLTCTKLILISISALMIGCGGSGGSGGSDSEPQVPSGYSISSLAFISQLTQGAFELSVSGAELNASYNWALEDSNGERLSGSGTVSSSQFVINGIDASSLLDGELVLSLFLVNSVGEGAAVSRMIEKDTVPPAGYSLTAASSDIDFDNQSNFSITVNDAEVSTSYRLVWEDENGSSDSVDGSVTTASFTIDNINVAALADGEIEFSLQLTDSTANSGIAQTVTVNKDISVSTVTLSGLISYEFVPHNTSTSALNYNAMEVKPARGVVVNAVDVSDQVVVTTTTDANGNYSLSVPQNMDLRLEAQARIRDTSPTFDFSVTDNTNNNALYVMRGSLVSSGSTDSVRNLFADSGWGGSAYTGTRVAGPFSIIDAVYDAVSAIVAVDTNVNMPSAELRWSVNNSPTPGNRADGNIGTTSYLPSEGNMYILGLENNDTDEYDQHVIVHEWGHYFEDKLSRSDSIGGGHSGVDFLDMRVAFSEGFANALSGIMLNDPVYRDSFGSQQGQGFSFDVSDNIINNPGWYKEDSAQAFVYDVNTSYGLVSLYNTLTDLDYINSPFLTTLHLFSAELRNHVNDDTDLLTAAGLQDFITNEQATGETNNGGDTNNLPIYKSLSVNGTAVQICSTKTNGEGNKLGNSQFLRVNISAAGNYTVTATRVSGLNSADPDIYVYDEGVAALIGESNSVNVESVSGNLTPNTYVIEVNEWSNVDFMFAGITGTGGDVCFDIQITN